MWALTIADAAFKLPVGILDGEIVALDANGVPDFAALQVKNLTVRICSPERIDTV